MRLIILAATISFLTSNAHAATIEGKSFPDSLSENKKSLVLNGVGLRSKRKLGLSFKVYVGGLYVTAKSSDPTTHIEGGDKVLELIFLRSLDAETLREAWSEAFGKNCQAECEKSAETLKQFNDMMVDVKEDSRLKMTFDPSGVAVEILGKADHKTGRITGSAFAKNLMAVFVGPQPPTEELKRGLLGVVK